MPLSQIFKSLQQIPLEKKGHIQISSELKISLSFIESGLLATLMDNKTVFIFKGSQDEIKSLREAGQILFGFECIKRPEFPSVRMYFELRGKINKPYRSDLFFGIESDEEMELLRRLKDQDHFDILFFTSKTECLKRVEIAEEDRGKIEAVLDEAVS